MSDIKTDPEGFLIDHRIWTPDIAHQLAKREAIILTDEHWFVINFLREFYQEFKHFPSMRVLIKLLKEKNSQCEINSQSLYLLFPDGPLKQGAKFAGLPKPPHCM